MYAGDENDKSTMARKCAAALLRKNRSADHPDVNNLRAFVETKRTSARRFELVVMLVFVPSEPSGKGVLVARDFAGDVTEAGREWDDEFDGDEDEIKDETVSEESDSDGSETETEVKSEPEDY